MDEFGKRLMGRKVSSIEASEFSWGVVFEEGGGLTVNTKVMAELHSDEGENVVTNYDSDENEIRISLGKRSFIHIDLTDEFMDGPETFVFCDADGTYIVGN